MSISYKELTVWQKSIDLCRDIYLLTKSFPKDEQYGLVSQMRRAAVSIPSNIAEGKYRGSDKYLLSFLRIAFASGAELETQILIAKDVLDISDALLMPASSKLDEVMKMLNTLILKIR